MEWARRVNDARNTATKARKSQDDAAQRIITAATKRISLKPSIYATKSKACVKTVTQGKAEAKKKLDELLAEYRKHGEDLKKARADEARADEEAEKAEILALKLEDEARVALGSVKNWTCGPAQPPTNPQDPYRPSPPHSAKY
ncbi:hypothetical protein HGRIS_011241 [Hohenbuehelia grisea]|uniref:Uncharacterized protein n=1 Tax=Hohenbuehelia grisea TaxID=104357 RepID=A0ABR3JW81_9AGAR